MTFTPRLTALLASVALALSTAAPVEAKPRKDNILAFMAGMAALAILSGAANGRPAPAPQPQPQPHPQPQPITYGLPPQCAILVQTNYGPAKVYTEQCLWRAGYRRTLPRDCVERVRTEYGWNEVYTDYCLRQRGY